MTIQSEESAGGEVSGNRDWGMLSIWGFSGAIFAVEIAVAIFCIRSLL